MAMVCGHVGPELVWLREDGQSGSENIQILMLSMQDEDQHGCAWALVFAVAEVTGNCWVRSFHHTGGLTSQSQQSFSGQISDCLY